MKCGNLPFVSDVEHLHLETNDAIHKATGSLVTGYSRNAAGRNIHHRLFPHPQLQTFFSFHWNSTSQCFSVWNGPERPGGGFVTSGIVPVKSWNGSEL